MDQDKNRNAARSFAQAFAGALAASIAKAGGSAWRLEVAEEQSRSARDAQALAFRMQVKGGLKGECFIEFYEPLLSALLGMQRAEAVERGAAGGAEAVAPLLSAAAAQLSAVLSERYGQLICKVDAVSELAWGGMFPVPVSVQSERPPSPAMTLYFDGELMEAFSVAAAGNDAGERVMQQVRPGNLRLVMEVELNVALRFGQRQLPLREVLELTSGSVIELDKMVDEPVEMLLDGKVVARGEAVIVDGNYGLRVTEITQAMESQLLGA